MKSRVNKIRNGIRGRQKQDFKLIVFVSFCGVTIIVLFTLLLNFSSVHRAKAKDLEIIRVEEQVFSNDMSIPAPVIKNEMVPGPNTIYIQQRKQINSSGQ